MILASLQRTSEISSFLELIAYSGTKTGIEIGAASCGTSVLLSSAMGKGSLLVSVDLPVEEDGTPVEFAEEATRQIEAEDGRFVLVRGKSSNEKTVQSVERVLGDRLVDLLLIDAEHTEEAAMSDFLAYSHLRSPRCITAFHDICTEALWGMWNRLRGSVTPDRSVEIIERVTQRDCGLGIVLGNK